jgi:hypothetical protein
MKQIKHTFVVMLFVVLSLFILPGNGWSVIELPHAFFNGLMITYTDNPAGDDLIFVSTKINSVFYSYGGSSTSDAVVGKNVVITGAVRNCPTTPCTTFTDATLTITDGSVDYLTATLRDIEFTTTNGIYWFLNPGLDINQEETLNLLDIVLIPNGSAYIQDLQNVLGSQDIAGMQMRLLNIVGNLTGNSTNVILEGLIDGVSAPSNSAPIAYAGENVSIASELVSETTILGTATDAEGGPLQCIWTSEGNVLLDAPAVDGDCPLDLSTLLIGVGEYTLTLEVVDDEQAASSDDMILTIDNTAPNAAPGGNGVYEVGDDVILTGDVSDFDGDLLHYEWLEGAAILCSGDIPATAGGDAVILPDCEVPGGLGLGMHTITLTADDGLNLPDSNDITVEVVDTTVPTIAPVASNYLLWPPNHVMIDIVIAANASDNSGLPVTLSAAITSNEPEDGLGDGDMAPDYTDAVDIDIDQDTGMIYFQLRRERSGTGDGRTYTVVITAEDDSENVSVTSLDIKVPHDKGKKK